MSNPLVSVLITSYNRENYISESIESVLASTYQDYELIIVDDFSTDRTYEIAKSYEAKDPRVKVYRNDKNLGQFPNRNRAAKLASGKYLKYLDSDDLIYPHGLEVMVDAMGSYPDAAFAMPGIPNENKPFPILVDGSAGLKKHFLSGNYFIYGPSALIFLSEAFMEVGGFGNNAYVGSDNEILIRMANRFKYLLIQPALIWWRVHDFQEINLGSLKFEYFLQGYRRNRLLIKECENSLSHIDSKKALKKLRNLYIMQSAKLVKSGKLKPVFEFLKSL